MALMQCTKMEDALVSTGSQATQEPPDVSLLEGTWINTHSAARGIVKAELAMTDGALTVRIFGAGDASPIDWGTVQGELYTDGVSAPQATSFTACFDFGFMDVSVQTYLAKGVLVLQSLTQFKDASGRSNYFAKEFFYRQ